MDYFIHVIHLRVYGAAAEGQRAALVGPRSVGGYERGLSCFRGDGSTYCVLEGCEDSRRTKAADRGDRVSGRCIP